MSYSSILKGKEWIFNLMQLEHPIQKMCLEACQAGMTSHYRGEKVYSGNKPHHFEGKIPDDVWLIFSQ